MRTFLQAARTHLGGWDERALLAAFVVAFLAAWSLLLAGPREAAWLGAAAVAAWFLVPLAARLAESLGAVARPGGRGAHGRTTPLLGGLAILVPLGCALWVDGQQGLFLGCVLIAFLGLVDDVRGVRARTKLLVQAAAAWILWRSGVGLPTLACPPLGTIETGVWEWPLLVVWVVLVTNAINLMDGLDGLASGVCLVACVGCAAVGIGGLAPLALAGALVGFLRHNLPEARVFLGDTGSLVLGFAMAGVLLDGGQGMNLTLCAGFLALPLGDVALSTVRRWIRGKPVCTADRGHVHHLLLQAWKTPGSVLGGLVGFGALNAIAAGLLPTASGLAIVTGLWAVLCSYLLVAARARWRHILRERCAFRRVNVARRYATAALPLSQDEAEVARILRRVAEDLGAAFLRPTEAASGSKGQDPATEPPGSIVWKPGPTGLGPVFEEERRAIAHDVLALANRVLMARRSDAVLPRAAHGAPWRLEPRMEEIS